jgi:hypothetical protein
LKHKLDWGFVGGAALLARIEVAYLSILRVVVLIAATVALVITTVGIVRGIPALTDAAGVSRPSEASGSSLAEYIDEKKATVPPQAAKGSAPKQRANRKSIPAEVHEAAVIFHDYFAGTKDAAKVSTENWEDIVLAAASASGHVSYPAFYSDNLALANQLKVSTGTKLSVSQVKELIVWNAHKLAQRNDMKVVEYDIATAKGWRALTVAAGSFLAFLLIIFTFLFVRVERNLRVVRTIREPAHEI